LEGCDEGEGEGLEGCDEGEADGFTGEGEGEGAAGEAPGGQLQPDTRKGAASADLMVYPNLWLCPAGMPPFCVRHAGRL
jgi:hypothetical protein